MSQLTMEQAKALLATTTTQQHLFEHAIGVSAAMGAMARHFGEDPAYWEAVGYLHDYDYEQFPEEHLRHTADELRAAGVEDEAAIRAILAHGYGGEALLDRLTRLLPRYGLPLDIPCDETALRRWLTRDKKAEGDQVTLALAEKAGQGRLVTVPLASLWEDTP